MSHEWSVSECEAVVGDYFEMLRAEVAGATYSKTRHRLMLALRLSGRTRASIEARHQNISAVLLEHGYRRIRGYPPKGRPEPRLEHAVLRYLHKHHEVEAAVRRADGPDAPGRPKGRPLPV